MKIIGFEWFTLTRSERLIALQFAVDENIKRWERRNVFITK